MHRIYYWRRPDRRRGLARLSVLIALCLSLVTDNAVAAGLTAA